MVIRYSVCLIDEASLFDRRCAFDTLRSNWVACIQYPSRCGEICVVNIRYGSDHSRCMSCVNLGTTSMTCDDSNDHTYGTARRAHR